MEKYNNYIRNKSFSQLANTGKTPDAVIQPTSNEHTNYNNRINRRKMQIGFDIALRNIGINKIKSKQQSKKIGNVSGHHIIHRQKYRNTHPVLKFSLRLFGF